MKAPAVEFSRPLLVARVPSGGSYEKLKADAKECLALAKRLDVPALHALTAEMRARPWRGGGLKLEGELKADIEQVSVVSLEAFRHVVTYPIERYFLPPGAVNRPDEEDDEADPIQNGEVDLGEVVAEVLALELDPYPRKPGEAFPDHIESDEVVPTRKSPFAGLTKLKPE